MPRYEDSDSDASRLPEGMTRVGYDADTQVYTFRDAADGSLWEGPPGARYGLLTRVSGPSPSLPPPPSSSSSYPPPAPSSSTPADLDGPPADDEQPPSYTDATSPSLSTPLQGRRGRRVTVVKNTPRPYAVEEDLDPSETPSWRGELMPLLNFFLLIGVFLLAVFWFMGYSRGSSSPSSSPAKTPAVADVDVCGTTGVPYVVKEGDTCWAIANAHGGEKDEKEGDNPFSVADLVAANQGLDCDRLQVGQAICLPVSVSGGSA